MIDLSLSPDEQYNRDWFDAGQPSGFLSHPHPSTRTQRVLDALDIDY